MTGSDSHGAAVSRARGHTHTDAEARPAQARPDGVAARARGDGLGDTPPARDAMRSLLGAGVAVEAFLLGLVAVAALGGLSQTISPLARAWPALLAPGRLIFGDAAVEMSVPSERGWPALALFAALLVGASCAAALAAGWGVRVRMPDRRYLALALGGAAVFGATLVLLPSLPSDDLFSYILYGRIAAVHGANPLVATPGDFPGDPFLSLVFWRGTRSVYGPAWLLLSQGLTLVAQALGGSLAAYTLIFKLLGFAAHVANAALIWAILGRLAPRRRVVGTLLYAWNPLCLLEFCASAHNDALMLTLALLGIYCLARGWEAPALVSFGLSISIKYVLLALLPLYLFWQARRLWERGERRLAALGLAIGWRLGLALGVVALTALPYWAGPATLAAILYSPPAQQLDNSLLDTVSWPLRALAQALGMPAALAGTLTQQALKALALLVFLALWLAQFRRARSLTGTIASWAWALFWYVVVASGWFWPWYVTWVVALAALLAPGELVVATLLLAGGALTLYAFLPLYAAPIYGFRSLLAFGPALGYLLYQHRAWLGGRLSRAGAALTRDSRRGLMVRGYPQSR